MRVLLYSLTAVMYLLVLSLHYIPNPVCQSIFGLPCDITQGR